MAQERWNVLREFHIRQSSASRVGLSKEFVQAKISEDGNVDEHMILMDVFLIYLRKLDVICGGDEVHFFHGQSTIIVR